jgi:outer membrane protein assembly factor BamB
LPGGGNRKAGRILTDQQGWQLITTKAKNYPESQPYLGTVTLHVRAKGEWVPKWETETDTLIWGAEPIFGDFDHDGHTEIACLPWYKLTILDAETGEVEAQCHFMHEGENTGVGGRAYGWFGAVDVDHSGKDEFIVLDDFTKHMEVLAWKDGTLQRLWVKLLRPIAYRIEVPSPEKDVSLRVNPEPVQDVDGDGNSEIVVSTYNISEDQLWHVWVVDPLTGEIRWDLAGMYLSGLRDVDGDGTPELFCTRVEKGMRVPAPADLSLVSLKGGKQKTLWNRKNASFQTYNVPEFSSERE